MSLSSAFSSYEAQYKAKIISQTFGHLDGDYRVKYPCVLVFCEGCYADVVIIQANLKPCGPATHEALHDWVNEQKLESGKEGV